MEIAAQNIGAFAPTLESSEYLPVKSDYERTMEVTEDARGQNDVRGRFVFLVNEIINCRLAKTDAGLSRE